MEMLPVEDIFDENKLLEIKDSKVLSHVNYLVPNLAQVTNSAGNAVQAAQFNSGELYKIIIPKGVKLADSKVIENAFRGIYHGADGIKGHANLVPMNAKKGASVVANTTAAAMQVASMVVGQYYMAQINTELGEISDSISKISDFQDNEYRSRVFSLVAHVNKIANFQVEILENHELRLSKIAQLDSLEEESTQLLGQANLTIVKYTQKKDLDYITYEKGLENIQNWCMYQNSLLKVLHKISDLRYALHLGKVSREQCTSLLPTYNQQVKEAKETLASWHEHIMEHYNIEIAESRRKRGGFDGALHYIPGLFNNDFKYEVISQKTTSLITSQSTDYEEINYYDTSELYAEDVQLIVKDGKIYYLPERKLDSMKIENKTIVNDDDCFTEDN